MNYGRECLISHQETYENTLAVEVKISAKKKSEKDIACIHHIKEI